MPAAAIDAPLVDELARLGFLITEADVVDWPGVRGSYVEGAALEPHKDRAQAEFSISLQIDHIPTPAGATGWPLCFTFDDGRTVAADLAIGDAVLYHGRALTHHRAALPAGERSSILVLEYVPDDFRGLRI